MASDEPVREVTAVRFGILAPDEIRLGSVCEVTNPRIYENNRPTVGGLFDLRMGTTNHEFACETCGGTPKTCTGHFGHIELPDPVYHPCFIDTVAKVLNVVCHHCSRIVFTQDAKLLAKLRSLKGLARLRYLVERSKQKKVRACGTCSAERPSVVEQWRTKTVPMEPVASSLTTTTLPPSKRARKRDRAAVPAVPPHADGSTTAPPETATATATARKFKFALPESVGVRGGGSVWGGGEPVTHVTVTPVGAGEAGCRGLQPRIVREGPKLIATWPDTRTVAKFLSGVVDDENDENENDDDAESATPSPAVVRKRRAMGASSTVPTAAAAETDEIKRQADDMASAARLLAKSDHFLVGDGAKPGARVPFNAKRAHAVLRRISDEDAVLLGFDIEHVHPSWLVLTVLLVSPPCLRPPISLTRSTKKRIALDHITFQLLQVLKKSLILHKQQKFRHNEWSNGFSDLLQYYVMTLIDNEIKGQPPARLESGRPVVSLGERLKGKLGRVRGNLQGKRVDFSARSPITPDPLIGMDELGVPHIVGNILTYPEAVTPENEQALQAAVVRGPHAECGGARYVIDAQGRHIDLRHRPDVAIGEGMVVERTMRDKDVVLFNRQPTLHKMSMMGHRVRLMPGSTFRLNLSATTPYNADFDGDEMNLHLAQGEEARAEVAALMMLDQQIVTPQKNAPVMGLVQDTLLAGRLFTKRDTFLQRDDYMQMSMWLEDDVASYKRARDGHMLEHDARPSTRLPVPAIVKAGAGGGPLWTGKQFVSTLLPSDFSLDTRSSFAPDRIGALDAATERWQDPSDTHVLVWRGELLCGTLDKKTLGTRANSIIHVLNNDYGGERVVRFVDAMQRAVGYQWMLGRSFSVGLGDACVCTETKERVAAIVDASRQRVEALADALRTGNLVAATGSTAEATFEGRVNEVLNRARDEAGNAVHDTLGIDNAFKFMETAGSKGSKTNMAQISGVLGQQNVNGRRMALAFGGRTTPHGTHAEMHTDIVARGFVPQSFMDGLQPVPFFAHGGGGREGLTHTAVKSVTGDTVIRVREGETMRTVAIGAWIDAMLEADASSVERYGPEQRNLELLAMAERKVHIPTCDERGVTSWAHMVAVTRHDPGETLYRITTHGGRTVTATASKSVLTYDRDTRTLHETAPSQLVIGRSAMPVIPAQWSVEPGERLGDVLLDPVVRVDTLDGASVAKVYDVTVPSTLNFALANGLVVRDTSDTGYLQRRMIKFSEELVEAYDKTVRNSLGQIVQFSYGDDDLDATFIEWQAVDLLAMDNEQLLRTYWMAGTPTVAAVRRIVGQGVRDRTVRALVRSVQRDGAEAQHELDERLVDEVRALATMRNGLRAALHGRDDRSLPIAGKVRRTIERAHTRFGQCEASSPGVFDTHWSAHDVLNRLDQLERTLCETGDAWVNHNDAGVASVCAERQRNQTFLFVLLVRSTLSPKRVRDEWRLSRVAFEWVVAELESQYAHARIAAGESVGVLAGQSVGEPTTQLCLNTFHFSGISSKNVTLGLPRMTELTQASKNIRTPCISIYLSPEERRADTFEEADRARRLANRLQFSTLVDVMQCSEVICDPLPGTCVERDRAFVERWYATETPPADAGPLSDYVVRLVLSRKAMTDRDYTVAYIAMRIQQHFGLAHMYVTHSDDNDMATSQLYKGPDGGKAATRRSAAAAAPSGSIIDKDGFRVPQLPQRRRSSTLVPVDATTSSYANEPHVQRREHHGHADTDESAGDDDASPVQTALAHAAAEAAQGGGDDQCDGGVIRLRLYQATLDAHVHTELPERAHMPDAHMFDVVDAASWRRDCIVAFVDDVRRHTLAMALGGVKHIDKVRAREVKCVTYDADSGALVANAKEWLLETSGTNMLHVLPLPGIDARRTCSNHPIEVQQVLGIEAARSVLLDELRNVISFDGSYVNYRHLALLCDAMTFGGLIAAISRHTLNKRKTGALMRCTFEQPVDVLMDAAVNAELDKVDSVSQAVVLGKPMPHGTGSITKVFLDAKAIAAQDAHERRYDYSAKVVTSNPYQQDAGGSAATAGNECCDGGDADHRKTRQVAPASSLQPAAASIGGGATSRIIHYNPFADATAGATAAPASTTHASSAITHNPFATAADDQPRDDCRQEHAPIFGHVVERGYVGYIPSSPLRPTSATQSRPPPPPPPCDHAAGYIPSSPVRRS